MLQVKVWKLKPRSEFKVSIAIFCQKFFFSKIWIWKKKIFIFKNITFYWSFWFDLLNILTVDVKITLNGVKNLTEGDTANISCTVSGSLYEPSSVMFVCISSACTSLMNQTSQTINTVYDNVSETFTTVLQAAPFSVTSDLNEVWIICPVSLNGSVLFSRDNVSVFCKCTN